jgi:DNA-binding response OmpR family regulator
MSSATARTSAEFTVLVYSDDAAVREKIRLAVGRRPAPDLGRVEYVEVATGADVIAKADAGGIDLLLLDAEAWPEGGMGLARQVKNELAACPPVCVVLARKVDRWLATWALADGTLSHPLDPIEAAEVVADLLRMRASRLPVAH